MGWGEVEYNGNTHTYAILSRELEPSLPGFMGYNDKAFLFISEDVPAHWRAYVLRHELREFTVLEDEPDRCVASLRVELKEVPVEERDSYIAWRREFFQELIAFYTERGTPDRTFMASIRASQELLTELSG
jgi:hypothetical protein